MKRTIIMSAFLVLAQCVCGAQSGPSVDVMGVLGYNTTWQWHTGADVRARVPVGDSIDLTSALELLSADAYAAGISARPHFALGAGECFLDGTLHSRRFACYDTYEFVYAMSAGYATKHFSVQAGLFAKMIGDTDMKWHSTEQIIAEPFNLLYRVSFSLKGNDAPWDISVAMSDFDEFQYERHWQPFFSMKGRWDATESLSLLAEGTLKPAGMFHLDCSFYGACLRLGAAYKF